MTLALFLISVLTLEWILKRAEKEKIRPGTGVKEWVPEEPAGLAGELSTTGMLSLVKAVERQGKAVHPERTGRVGWGAGEGAGEAGVAARRNR